MALLTDAEIDVMARAILNSHELHPLTPTAVRRLCAQAKLANAPAPAARQGEWVSVPDTKSVPVGSWLVYLEEDMLRRRIHSATVHPNVTIVGGCFSFDAPRVTHYAPLPAPPSAAPSAPGSGGEKEK